MRRNACLRKAMGLEGRCPTRCIAGMGATWGIKRGAEVPEHRGQGSRYDCMVERWSLGVETDKGRAGTQLAEAAGVG